MAGQARPDERPRKGMLCIDSSRSAAAVLCRAGPVPPRRAGGRCARQRFDPIRGRRPTRLLRPGTGTGPDLAGHRRAWGPQQRLPERVGSDDIEPIREHDRGGARDGPSAARRLVRSARVCPRDLFSVLSVLTASTLRQGGGVCARPCQYPSQQGLPQVVRRKIQ
jgi:hypothetical protein